MARHVERRKTPRPVGWRTPAMQRMERVLSDARRFLRELDRVLGAENRPKRSPG